MAHPSIHLSRRPLIGVTAVMSSLHITIKPRKATTNRLASLSKNPPSPLLLLAEKLFPSTLLLKQVNFHLNSYNHKKLVIGFDCEGVDLCRNGTLCIMQVRHFDLLPEKGWEVDLDAVKALADEAIVLINPWNIVEMFLQLIICKTDNNFADWPPLSPIPGVCNWAGDASEESGSHSEGKDGGNLLLRFIRMKKENITGVLKVKVPSSQGGRSNTLFGTTVDIGKLNSQFEATFGRETSMKDKQWFKRRISMGLSNSCDVSTTTFIIENNTIIKKPKVEDHNDDNKEYLVGLEGTNGSSNNISVVQSQTLQMADDLGGNSKSVQSESANRPKNHNQLTSEDDN
ncbi:hypothetical protein L1887_26618 [Cichorium endivia]|nr:hypothetical protein L1887_26618 [Cichorium endivia]